MRYEFTVGLRYLFSKKGDFLVSVITLISIVGVALGVMALLVVLSVVSGFENDFRKKILGNNAHLIVVKPGERHIDYDATLPGKIDVLPPVRGASPFLYEEVLLRGKSDRATGVLLYGVDPERVGEVTTLSKDMVSGKLIDLAAQDDLPGIIVGEEIANHLLFLLPGDTVDVLSPSGELSPFGLSPKIRRFRVVGVFKSGLYEYDARSAYIDLRQAQHFFNQPNRVSGYQISLKNPDKAIDDARVVQRTVGENYMVRTWMELNRDLFSAFKLEKTVFFIVMTMIILVAAFNIVGTLVLVVTEKAREIAILKAIGARQSSVQKIFIATGCIIGAVGTVFGLLGAWVLIILLRDYINFPLNSNVYQIDKLPAVLNPYDFLAVAIAAMCISFLATLYPSIKASRQDPVEGLRYE